MCLWPSFALCSLGRPDIDKGLNSIPAARVPEASQKACLATNTSKPSIPEVPGSPVPHEDAGGFEAMPPAMPSMKVGAHPTLTNPAMLKETVNDWHVPSSMPKTAESF